MVALSIHALVGIAHGRDMVREVPHTQHHIKLGGAVHGIERLIQLAGHGPPAPTVSDGRSHEMRVPHSEVTGHVAARAFAIHVNAPGVDGISPFRPREQLLDWLVIGLSEPSAWALRTNRQKHILIAQSQPSERLANRKDVCAGRGSMFLEAKDYAHLPRRIDGVRGRDVSRGFYYVAENGFTGFVF